MNKKSITKPGKLEDDALWREACDLAEFMYGKLDDFPQDEKWNSAVKLRNAANDLMFVIGQASGSANPIGAEYEWGNARKYASGLKTIYRFTGRQKFIDFDPSIMVRLDKLIEQIDKQFDKGEKRSEAYWQKDINDWHKKYKLWKKMNHEN
jgi:hypothetical protein